MKETKTSVQASLIINITLIKEWFTTEDGLVKFKKWLNRQSDGLEALNIVLETMRINWANWSQYFSLPKMQAFIAQAIDLACQKLAVASDFALASKQILDFLQLPHAIFHKYPAQKGPLVRTLGKAPTVKNCAIDALLNNTVTLLANNKIRSVVSAQLNPTVLFNLLKTLEAQGLLSDKNLAGTVESIGLFANAGLFLTQKTEMISGKVEHFAKDWLQWEKWLDTKLQRSKITSTAASQILSGMVAQAENHFLMGLWPTELINKLLRALLTPPTNNETIFSGLSCVKILVTDLLLTDITTVDMNLLGHLLCGPQDVKSSASLSSMQANSAAQIVEICRKIKTVSSTSKLINPPQMQTALKQALTAKPGDAAKLMVSIAHILQDSGQTAEEISLKEAAQQIVLASNQADVAAAMTLPEIAHILYALILPPKGGWKDIKPTNYLVETFFKKLADELASPIPNLSDDKLNSAVQQVSEYLWLTGQKLPDQLKERLALRRRHITPDSWQHRFFEFIKQQPQLTEYYTDFKEEEDIDGKGYACADITFINKQTGKKVIVEVDGPHHKLRREQDKRRDEHLWKSIGGTLEDIIRIPIGPHSTLESLWTFLLQELNAPVVHSEEEAKAGSSAQAFREEKKGFQPPAVEIETVASSPKEPVLQVAEEQPLGYGARKDDVGGDCVSGGSAREEGVVLSLAENKDKKHETKPRDDKPSKAGLLLAIKNKDLAVINKLLKPSIFEKPEEADVEKAEILIYALEQDDSSKKAALVIHALVKAFSQAVICTNVGQKSPVERAVELGNKTAISVFIEKSTRRKIKDNRVWLRALRLAKETEKNEIAVLIEKAGITLSTPMSVQPSSAPLSQPSLPQQNPKVSEKDTEIKYKDKESKYLEVKPRDDEKTADQSLTCRLSNCQCSSCRTQSNDSIRINHTKILAMQMDPKAQFRWAQRFYATRTDPSDLAEFLYWLKLSAGQNYIEAQVMLGAFYIRKKDRSKEELAMGLELIISLAERGHRMGQYNLGALYLNGIGVPKDPVKARELFKLAADQGLCHAQFALGECCRVGEGGVKDVKEAATWYDLAAAQGDMEAQYWLGNLYFAGEGIEKDVKEGLKRYRLAAEGESVKAQFNLGACYLNGNGVRKDIKEGLKWYRRGADQGDPICQYALAKLYFEGEGVVKDLQEAMRLCRLAAEQGLDLAQLTISNLYQAGLGVKQDSKEAYRWCQLAAQQGTPLAQYTFAQINSKGEGIPKDLKEAVRYTRLAAEQAYPPAQYLLGMFYWKGDGMEQNTTEALRWCRLAAEQGDADAQLALGSCYLSGEGGEQDLFQASVLLQAAAQQGVVKALEFIQEHEPQICALAEEYETGSKGCKDNDKAITLYKILAKRSLSSERVQKAKSALARLLQLSTSVPEKRVELSAQEVVPPVLSFPTNISSLIHSKVLGSPLHTSAAPKKLQNSQALDDKTNKTSTATVTPPGVSIL